MIEFLNIEKKKNVVSFYFNLKEYLRKEIFRCYN